jgi:hypothetical protein
VKTFFLTLLVSSSVFAATPALSPLTQISGADVVTGKPVSIDAKQSKLATAVIFLSAHCPCSASHEATLKALHAEFGDVQFIGVHSNADEPALFTKQHFEQANLGFAVIDDPKDVIADAFKANKTPHVFVVSPAGEILYSGGVTDSHEASRAKKQYLQDALTAIKGGQTPKVSDTRTLGCVISRKS